MILPKFNGWRALDGDEEVIRGDVFVMISKDCLAFINMEPKNGNIAGRNSVGLKAKLWGNTEWWPYRKHKDMTIPTRLVMNKSFSESLPLP